MPAMLRFIEHHPCGKRLLCMLLALGVGCAMAGASGADEEISQIAAEWSRHYGELSHQAAYHYRCTIETTELVPNVERPLNFFVPPRYPLAIELYRSGELARLETMRGHDFAAMREMGYIEIFAGDCGYVISCENQHHSIQSTQQPRAHVISQTLANIDPLADVLGLPVRYPYPEAGMGGGAETPFDVEAALQTGRYRVIKSDATTVTLAAAGVDELVLSRQHSYAVLRRTWHWSAGQPVKCVIENSDWRQLSTGAWYPAKSELLYDTPPAIAPSEPWLKSSWRFEMLTPATPADFDYVADQPGWTIGVSMPDKQFRQLQLKAGESIRLSKVASGEIELQMRAQGGDLSRVRQNAQRELLTAIAVVIAIVVMFEIARVVRRV